VFSEHIGYSHRGFCALLDACPAHWSVVAVVALLAGVKHTLNAGFFERYAVLMS
jgi:hypothetical protein